MAEDDDTIEVAAVDFTDADIALAESVRSMTVADVLKVENTKALRAFAVVAMLEQLAAYCLVTDTTVPKARAMTVGELAAACDVLTRQGGNQWPGVSES